MRQVLALQAPTPRVADTAGSSEPKKKERTESFFEKDKTPRDDAPIEDLLEYWQRWIEHSRAPKLSDTVRQRLIDAALDDAAMMTVFMRLLPTDESTAKKVKALYDRLLNEQTPDADSIEKIKRWLLYYSKYFVNELLKPSDRNATGFARDTSIEILSTTPEGPFASLKRRVCKELRWTGSS